MAHWYDEATRRISDDRSSDNLRAVLDDRSSDNLSAVLDDSRLRACESSLR